MDNFEEKLRPVMRQPPGFPAMSLQMPNALDTTGTDVPNLYHLSMLGEWELYNQMLNLFPEYSKEKVWVCVKRPLHRLMPCTRPIVWRRVLDDLINGCQWYVEHAAPQLVEPTLTDRMSISSSEWHMEALAPQCAQPKSTASSTVTSAETSTTASVSKVVKTRSVPTGHVPKVKRTYAQVVGTSSKEQQSLKHDSKSATDHSASKRHKEEVRSKPCNEQASRDCRRPCFIKGCGTLVTKMRMHILTKHLPDCFSTLAQMDDTTRHNQIMVYLEKVLSETDEDSIAGLYATATEQGWFPYRHKSQKYPLNPHDEELIRSFYPLAPQNLTINPPNCPQMMVHWRVLASVLNGANLQHLLKKEQTAPSEATSEDLGPEPHIEVGEVGIINKMWEGGVAAVVKTKRSMVMYNLLIHISIMISWSNVPDRITFRLCCSSALLTRRSLH
jgi:hypothetical protein